MCVAHDSMHTSLLYVAKKHVNVAVDVEDIKLVIETKILSCCNFSEFLHLKYIQCKLRVIHNKQYNTSCVIMHQILNFIDGRHVTIKCVYGICPIMI